jgi:hypothetical protein
MAKGLWAIMAQRESLQRAAVAIAARYDKPVSSP